MKTLPPKNGRVRTSGRSRGGVALRQLGWPHYWLLVAILGSGLVFYVLILLVVSAET